MTRRRLRAGDGRRHPRTTGSLVECVASADFDNVEHVESPYATRDGAAGCSADMLTTLGPGSHGRRGLRRWLPGGAPDPTAWPSSFGLHSGNQNGRHLGISVRLASTHARLHKTEPSGSRSLTRRTPLTQEEDGKEGHERVHVR